MKPTPPPTPPKLELVPVIEGDGTDDTVVLHAKYPWQWFRFMLNDGQTVDVFAVRDDSDMRGAVLEATKATKIEGVARLQR